MNCKVYERGQMVIPAGARRQARIAVGDLLSVQVEGDGKIILIRLEEPKPPPPIKPKVIHRKGRHPVLDIGRKVTEEEIKAALEDFP